MKHRPKHVTNLLPRVRTVVDRLRELGAEILSVVRHGVVRIRCRIGGQVEHVTRPSQPRDAPRVVAVRRAKVEVVRARHARAAAC